MASAFSDSPGVVLCMDAIDFLRSCDNVALVLTDIPYGVVSRANNGLRCFSNLDKDFADRVTFSHRVFAHAVADVAESCYIFCGAEQLSDIRGILSARGMTTRVGVWEKTNPCPANGQHVWLSGIELCVFGKRRGATFRGHCRNTVWRHPMMRKRNHPTPKPVSLFQDLIEMSTNPGDVVVDPCVGGGTTAIAALRSGRKFIVGDISAQCVKWTREWVEEELKQKKCIRS